MRTQPTHTFFLTTMPYSCIYGLWQYGWSYERSISVPNDGDFLYSVSMCFFFSGNSTEKKNNGNILSLSMLHFSFNSMFSLFLFNLFFPFQDEKNQILTTNAWLNLVCNRRIHNGGNNNDNSWKSTTNAISIKRFPREIVILIVDASSCPSWAESPIFINFIIIMSQHDVFFPALNALFSLYLQHAHVFCIAHSTRWHIFRAGTWMWVSPSNFQSNGVN